MCAKRVDRSLIFCTTIVLFYAVVSSGLPLPPNLQAKWYSRQNESGLLKSGLTENTSAINVRFTYAEHSGIEKSSMKTGVNKSKAVDTHEQKKPVLTKNKARFTKVDRLGRRNLDVLLRELSDNFYNEGDGEKGHDEVLRDVEMSRMVDLGHALAPVFSRLHRRASFRERLPLIFDEHVSIGRARVAKRRATVVGDIDGNGVFDIVIADPVAKNESGKARLFLMTKGAHYLYSREITPGNSEFDAPELKPGHRYGTAVFRLPGGNATTGSFVAISAPGDGKHGAIYILKISRKGNILCHAKTQLRGRGSHVSYKAVQLSSLEKGHPKVQTVRPEITDGLDNLGILSDVRKIVFQAPDGEVLVTLAVDSATDANLLGLVESEYLLSTSLRPIQNVDVLPRFSVKVGVDSGASHTGECHLNSTHCSCDESNQEREKCLKFLRKDDMSHRSICSPFDCPRYVRCRCGGKHVCERSEQESGSYVRDGKIAVPGSEGNEVYCKIASSRTTIYQDGDSVYSFMEQGSLELFNETHCLCSQRASTHGGQCLRYFRTSYGLAIYCTWKPCQVGDDEYQCDSLGTAYCRRDLAAKSYWVNDGIVVGLDNVVYCHEVKGNFEKISFLIDV